MLDKMFARGSGRTRRSVKAQLSAAGLVVLTFWLFFSDGVGKSVATVDVFLQDTMNSTLGFEKVFVLSLPARTDRRDGMLLAADLTNISLTFFDAVRGADVLDAAIPGGGRKFVPFQSEGHIGSWRSHMNLLHEIVARNYSSALILEDDLDWDLRIKRQMRDFARSSRAMMQPLKVPVPNDKLKPGGTQRYLDEQYPTPYDQGVPGERFDFDRLPETERPMLSPYGDDWDVLWLGHCGMRLPGPNTVSANLMPKGVIEQRDDWTVPPPMHLRNIWSDSLPGVATAELRDQFPAHTRIVHHVSNAACSLAYAVSWHGARRLLAALGNDVGVWDDVLAGAEAAEAQAEAEAEANGNIDTHDSGVYPQRRVTGVDENGRIDASRTVGMEYDLRLSAWCEGRSGTGLRYHECLTVQPGLFEHWRERGLRRGSADSDIRGSSVKSASESEMETAPDRREHDREDEAGPSMARDPDVKKTKKKKEARSWSWKTRHEPDAVISAADPALRRTEQLIEDIGSEAEDHHPPFSSPPEDKSDLASDTPIDQGDGDGGNSASNPSSSPTPPQHSASWRYRGRSWNIRWSVRDNWTRMRERRRGGDVSAETKPRDQWPETRAVEG